MVNAHLGKSVLEKLHFSQSHQPTVSVLQFGGQTGSVFDIIDEAKHEEGCSG